MFCEINMMICKEMKPIRGDWHEMLVFYKKKNADDMEFIDPMNLSLDSKKAICHDCKVEEGQLHRPNCDMERCPNCGGQLISCGCTIEEVDAVGYKIPWIQIPVLCTTCGEPFPEFFNVPDEEWEKYVPPNLQGEVLCKICYKRLQTLFPNGWRNVDGGE